MTPEELKKKLEQAGVPTGAWAEGGGKTVASPLMAKQKHLLEELSRLLKVQVESDVTKVAELQATLTRLKKGGGR